MSSGKRTVVKACNLFFSAYNQTRLKQGLWVSYTVRVSQQVRYSVLELNIRNNVAVI